MKFVNTPVKTNLLDLSREQLAQFFVELGEKPYRAQQLLKWVHQVGVTDFALMTNFSKQLRNNLQAIATIAIPEVVYDQASRDGTQKWLLKLSCGNCVETVFIPEDDRGTLCISSQIGCGLTCSFCATGSMGFNRNLTTGEIISQLWVAVRRLSQANGVHDKRVTNVVMMGMGEPLLNFDNVVNALELMLEDFAYGLSKRRVTLSSSGLVPQLQQLSQISGVSLAISLHAPNDELRDVLVPINKKYPLSQLLEVCKYYFANEPRRKVTFEYVMLEDVNDSDGHARQLAKILEGIPAKVNLIPFNPFNGTQYRRSSQQRIAAFSRILTDKGINTITRKTRGDDIDAACGQLVGNFTDRTTRSERWRKIHVVKAESLPLTE